MLKVRDFKETAIAELRISTTAETSSALAYKPKQNLHFSTRILSRASPKAPHASPVEAHLPRFETSKDYRVRRGCLCNWTHGCTSEYGREATWPRLLDARSRIVVGICSGCLGSESLEG